jgi:muramoyltetrapeptide carboxypeptidase
VAVVKKIKSRALQVGAKIGIVAPASPVDTLEEINQAVSMLIEQGFPVVCGASAAPNTGDLAGTDMMRQTDLEQFWQDQSIQAIWCLRGGYGSFRLLPHLWYGLIARNPKILVGFSDITALELGIWSQVSLVTFHGPVLTGLKSEFTIKQAMKMVSGGWESTRLDWPADGLKKYIPIHSGKAQGIVLGGNLTTFNSLLGTRFLPHLDGIILFLEDIGEQAYRIDRMLSQLMISGIIDSVSAVLIGQCIPPSNQTEADLVKVFIERLSALSCPVAYGFPFGHVQEQWTVPQGVLAEVDTATGCLTLLESPVV